MTVKTARRRIRLKNREVQAVIEILVEVWREALVSGGRIELEHFIVQKTLPSGRIRLSVSTELRSKTNGLLTATDRK